MPTLRYGRPLWVDAQRGRDRRTPAHYPTLRGSIDADVVIVGGGITGAVAAYLFSRAGVRVVLLEAERMAAGSTAASTALLMQEPDKDLTELARRYGWRDAVRIWRALAQATEEMASTIRRLRIRCDLRAEDSIYFTADKKKVAVLRRELRRRRAARLPGKWLSGEALRRRFGVCAAGGIVTHGNYQADPILACRGFLRAARAQGARVFERSRVRHVTTIDEGIRVETAHGSVRAAFVIVATGYATPMFTPRAGRSRLKDTFVIATRRIAPRVRRRARAHEHAMLWDTNRPYYYARWSRDGRLLVGGADVRHHGSLSSAPARKRLNTRADRLRRYLAKLLPELADQPIEYAWEGIFAETTDGLPFIGAHRRHPRHLFALGYGGNGMTASFLAAKLLLARYRNHPDSREALFSFNR
jgi:glycine/D-amino acid oxidase-like deaminating enzyme